MDEAFNLCKHLFKFVPQLKTQQYEAQDGQLVILEWNEAAQRFEPMEIVTK